MHKTMQYTYTRAFALAMVVAVVLLRERICGCAREDGGCEHYCCGWQAEVMMSLVGCPPSPPPSENSGTALWDSGLLTPLHQKDLRCCGLGKASVTQKMKI
jgi:hypothetical protein